MHRQHDVTMSYMCMLLHYLMYKSCYVLRVKLASLAYNSLPDELQDL